MAEAWRLFIALELPPEIIQHIAAVQQGLKQRAPQGAVRWVKPGNIHLTLKFLGDVPIDQREALEDALAQVVEDRAPFQLAAGGLGCFPNARRPSVIWMGLTDDIATLHALRDAVEAHIAPLGYPTDDRPFHPHLTLGRVRRETGRSDAQQLGDLIANSTAKISAPWRVSQVTLIRSQLRPGGSVYTPLFHATLEAQS